LYSAYPSPSGRLYALRAKCVTRVTRQTGKLNEERSRTITSRSQQQIRMESKFTATTGIWTRDHWDAGAPFLPLDQVPPPLSRKQVHCKTNNEGSTFYW
jgi:hypothetical protein